MVFLQATHSSARPRSAARIIASMFLITLAACTVSKPVVKGYDLLPERYAEVSDFNYIRTGKVRLLPFVSWIESTSISRAPLPPVRNDYYSCRVRIPSVFGGLSISWSVVYPCEMEIARGDLLRTYLTEASNYLISSGIVDEDVRVDLFLSTEEHSIESIKTNYYIFVPRFSFHLAVDLNDGSGGLYAVASNLGVVFHEIFHYSMLRYSGNHLIRNVPYADIKEEVQAYAAEECGKIWIAAHIPEARYKLEKSILLEDAALGDIYYRYGATAVGRLVLNHVVFEMLPTYDTIRVVDKVPEEVADACRDILAPEFDLSQYWQSSL